MCYMLERVLWDRTYRTGYNNSYVKDKIACRKQKKERTFMGGCRGSRGTLFIKIGRKVNLGQNPELRCWRKTWIDEVSDELQKRQLRLESQGEHKDK